MTIERIGECVGRASVPLLGGHGEATALVSAAGPVTFAALADRVTQRTAELGATRRLVLLEAAPDVESVVTLLAALAGRHPVLLAAPGDLDRHAELVERYRPDVVQVAGGAPRVLREGTAHDLHPDLAMLLSTSGSTGSPKLVRLSLANLEANAAAIADYLAIRPTDRAITSLPLHYCYGLSVLTSHLVRGAGVVLTDLSVADECFWDLADRAGVTGVAGVPYTFELLEASGFRDREVPTLRYLTQAGGRMDPHRVRSFAELGRVRGWDLFVMYGQTEATARMAYLPPDLATSRPGAVGVPISGGSFRLAPAPEEVEVEDGVGELVYAGPNVMLGYAEQPADLARGAELAELPTGDLGRLAEDGLWEVVGRLGRQAKLFGLRLDLDRLEQLLAAEGLPARVLVRGDRLWACTARPRSVDRTRRALLGATGLPPSAVRVVRLHALPETPSGKPDRAVLVAHVDRLVADEQADPAPVTAEAIRDLYAVLLGRPDAGVNDSFVRLGGDSLSYVEASTRLGEALGTLPAGWQRLDPVALAGARQRRRRFTVPVDLSVVLRALAVILILVSHADLAQLQGGAHILLGVAGFNLARFQLGVPGRGARLRAILRSGVLVAVPAALWIGAVIVVAGGYRWETALFLNGLTGSDSWTDDWQFWFLEALVWGYLGVAALLAVPWVDRWQRRRPFAVALAVLAGCLALRYSIVGVEAGPTERYSMVVVLWCLALGWAAAAARTSGRRLLVGVVAAVSTIGFFNDPQREAVVVAGILFLLLDRAVLLPRALATVAQVVATASLWVYLTQWQVYPELEDAGHPYAAVLASLAVGIVVQQTYDRVSPRVLGRWRRRPSRRTAWSSTPGRAPSARAAGG